MHNSYNWRTVIKVKGQNEVRGLNLHQGVFIGRGTDYVAGTYAGGPNFTTANTYEINLAKVFNSIY